MQAEVVDIDVIPLEELKRPRIDVTIRISGILRDSFPDAIKLMDKAIVMASSLDEPLSENFVKKNTLNIEKYLLDIGQDKDINRHATMRIFGDKPGAYGAGVDLALKASAWKDEEDIAKVFVHFSSYAYGENLNGDTAKYEFVKKNKRFLRYLTKLPALKDIIYYLPAFFLLFKVALV